MGTRRVGNVSASFVPIVDVDNGRKLTFGIFNILINQKLGGNSNLSVSIVCRNNETDVHCGKCRGGINEIRTFCRDLVQNFTNTKMVLYFFFEKKNIYWNLTYGEHCLQIFSVAINRKLFETNVELVGNYKILLKYKLFPEKR